MLFRSVSVGSTGSFLRFVLSTKAGYPTRGMLHLCVHPACESVHVQEMAGFYPWNTLPEANISGLPLTGYKQVVGQGVASIASWRPPFPHGHHSRAIQRQTAVWEGNGRRQGL